ncbi:MAG: hypothetical protein F4Z76_04010 [Rhodothermaceae bacterium]|nr:hypothetical protein [Rhodothermaceae bacterium]MYE64278.1 hypothetical protein [Rhodothermaceae bacterium]
MKNSDYVICFRRGGGRYTMLDLGTVVEATSHRRALEIFLQKVGVYAYVRIVTVRGDHDMLMKADVAVFRKATETEYKAFFDLEPKQNPFPLTDRIRGKIYVDRLARCEIERRQTEA